MFISENGVDDQYGALLPHEPDGLSFRSCGCSWPFAVAGLVALGVIVVIMYPVFVKAREMFRYQDCQTNIRYLALGMQMYANDYDGHLPSSPTGISDQAFETERGREMPTGRVVTWAEAVSRYKKGHFRCPTDKRGSMVLSYSYKHAVHLAAKVGLKDPDFGFPSEQVMLYEKKSFHWDGEPLREGSSLNVAYYDAHCKVVRMKDMAPDCEPGFFNVVDEQAAKGKALTKPYWDPRYCLDRLP